MSRGRRTNAAKDGVSNSEVKDEVVRLLAGFCTFDDAANAVDVDPKTIWRWRREDQEFARRVKKAIRSAKIMLITKIAADRDWKAAKELLACRHPDEYANRSKLEHSGPDGGAIPIQAAILKAESLTDDQLADELERRAKQLRAGANED